MVQNKCNSSLKNKIFISGSKIRKKLEKKLPIQDYIIDKKIYEILWKYKEN